jgi:hypothetical protein
MKFVLKRQALFAFVFLFFSVVPLHTQNKGFYFDIGDGYFFDLSDRFSSGGLAPLVISSSYFAKNGIGVSLAYGYYAFGQKDNPFHSHSVYGGVNYSIPANSSIGVFPVTYSFGAGLFTQFNDKTVLAPTITWDSFVKGRGVIFSHFYIINRFTLYYFFDDSGIPRGGPFYLAWSIGSGFSL